MSIHLGTLVVGSSRFLLKHPRCFKNKWWHMEFPLQCTRMCVLYYCVCVCGLSLIRVTGWLGFYEAKVQQEQGRVTLWPQVKQERNVTTQHSHFYSLHFNLCRHPSPSSLVGFSLSFFSHQIVSHIHYIRRWFLAQPQEKPNWFLQC